MGAKTMDHGASKTGRSSVGLLLIATALVLAASGLLYLAVGFARPQAPTPLPLQPTMAAVVHTQPRAPVNKATPPPSVPLRYRGVIVRKRVRYFPRKLLALTFDDGPDPTLTPEALDNLKARGAHATFFVIGRSAKRHLDLVRRAAEEGNAIGVHSYTHPARATPAQAVEEIDKTAALIEQATGRKPQLFRPPYGITNGNLCREAQRQGYAVILWTISSADSDPISSSIIAHNVIHTPNPGDIVLMHDGPGHVATAKALPQILDQLGAQGFKFVTIPELLQAWDRWLDEQGKTTARRKG